MGSKFDFVDAELERRRASNQMRALRSVSPRGGVAVCAEGRALLNFSSNDYLGLSSHPLLRQRAAEFAERYGMGATAARLVCGSHPGFAQVEERLARLKGEARALVLNSG